MEDELKHYGVVGMKWGVRKNPQKAYSKAVKKLERLDKKVQKKEAKFGKRLKKYNKAKFSYSLYSVKNQTPKLKKAAYKHEQKVRKAAKWVSRMEKEFANTDVKFSQDVIDKGKSYTDLITKRDDERTMRLI